MTVYSWRIIQAPRLIEALTPIDAYAVTVWPFIFTSGPLGPRGLRHERIHLAQQLECGLVGFYLLYLWYWARGRLAGLSTREAYVAIPFELEAYGAQGLEGYLNTRPRWAWRAFR